jgi:hypothetical protein
LDVLKAGEKNSWPSIPRIRAHCLVEMTLEKCVQKLRKRISDGESFPPKHNKHNHGFPALKTIGELDRTPSFYTSRSILNFSGLSVSDPLPTNLQGIHHEMNKRNDSHSSIHGSMTKHHGIRKII